MCNETTYEIQDKGKQIKKKIQIFSIITGNSTPLHTRINPENCVRNFNVALSSEMAKKDVECSEFLAKKSRK